MHPPPPSLPYLPGGTRSGDVDAHSGGGVRQNRLAETRLWPRVQTLKSAPERPSGLMARRRRAQTTVTREWISQRWIMGAPASLANRLRDYQDEKQ